MSPSVPPWFTQALAETPESRRVPVNGTEVHYLRWGNPARPGLVLVHGGAAHAHWWDFLAPLFTRHYHVAALDLSGHGDSGRRDHYPREGWADEILAVADDAGFPGPPVVVGHSMGGLVTIFTASLHGDRLAGAVIVDAPVRRADPEGEERRKGRSSFDHLKIYPSREAALSRFRLVPEQPCDNGFIVDHIAGHSLREHDGGWAWKFDPAVFAKPFPPMQEYLESVRCRVAMFRGEHSKVVPPETGAYMYELLGRNAPLVEIPEAHHHLILDQPLAFVAALRAILADWEHSVPRART